MVYITILKLRTMIINAKKKELIEQNEETGRKTLIKKVLKKTKATFEYEEEEDYYTEN